MRGLLSGVSASSCTERSSEIRKSSKDLGFSSPVRLLTEEIDPQALSELVNGNGFGATGFRLWVLCWIQADLFASSLSQEP